MFGIHEKVVSNENGILPAETKNGMKIMSINLLLEHDTDPVVWRGPLIAGTVKQFWTDVCWGDVDYMFVDMPSGIGDVPLTVFQSLPVDGIIVVTSPQELVGMIVGKAVKMAEMLHIPVLGIVENMAYFECPSLRILRRSEKRQGYSPMLRKRLWLSVLLTAAAVLVKRQFCGQGNL